jgi:hypothetical protein
MILMITFVHALVTMHVPFRGATRDARRSKGIKWWRLLGSQQLLLLVFTSERNFLDRSLTATTTV